jgi:hypothetical protein
MSEIVSPPTVQCTSFNYGDRPSNAHSNSLRLQSHMQAASEDERYRLPGRQGIPIHSSRSEAWATVASALGRNTPGGVGQGTDRRRRVLPLPKEHKWSQDGWFAPAMSVDRFRRLSEDSRPRERPD